MEYASKGLAGTALGFGIGGAALGLANGGLGNLLGGLNRPEFYAALAKAFLIDKDGPGPERKLMEYYEHIAK